MKYLLVFLTLTLALTIHGTCQSTHTIISYDIKTATVWTKERSPYLVTKNININERLTIEAGVVVEFDEYISMSVYNAGSFNVAGNIKDSVFFRPSSSNLGHWEGISVYPSVDSVNIRYLNLKKSRYGIEIIGAISSITNSTFENNEEYSVIISRNQSYATFDSCTFKHSKVGVYCSNISDSASITVQNSTFVYDTVGVELYNIRVPCNTSHSTFTHNSSAFVLYNSEASVQKNIFNNNKYGVEVCGYPEKSIVSCNTFLNNLSYNIFFNTKKLVDKDFEYTLNAKHNYYGLFSVDSIRATTNNSDSVFNISIEIEPFVSNPTLSIVKQPEGKSLCMNYRMELSVTANRIDLAYEWFKDGVSLKNDTAFQGANTPTLRAERAKGEMSGVYTCSIQSECDIIISNEANVLIKQPYNLDSLALATVSDNGKNVLLVWERTANKETVVYNIYREEYTDEFKKIGEVPFTNGTRSIFLDSTADVNSRAYRYKITTTDLCKNEQPLNKAVSQKTIHLKRTLVDNELKFDWTLYQGAKVRGYCLLKGESYEAMDTIERLGNDMTSSTIINPGNNKFRIVCVFAREIKPGLLKSDGGPYSYSMSNIAESQLTKQCTKTSPIYTICPKVTHSRFSVLGGDNQEELKIEIFNEIGTQVSTSHARTGKEITVTDLACGVYFVKITSQTAVSYANLIKIK